DRTHLVPNSRALLAQLYDLLIQPALGWLDDRRRLIVVPHGLLHQVPFAALFDGVSYLVERFELVFAPSASSLVFCCRPRSSRTGRSLVVGHSGAGTLPGAVAEAQAVAGAFNADLLLEDEATLAGLHAHARGRDIIHLATHGLSRLDAPLFSHLQLADGQLTA